MDNIKIVEKLNQSRDQLFDMASNLSSIDDGYYQYADLERKDLPKALSASPQLNTL